MSQVNVDTREVRSFIGDLRSKVSEIEGLSDALWQKFSNLGETWRDREYDRFEEVLDETLRIIRQFKDDAEEQAVHLEKKVSDLENSGWAG